MAVQTRKRSNGHARPIRSKRDYDGASAVVKRLSAQAHRESEAELRLQSLIRELDRYEAADEDAAGELGGVDEDYGGPHRRWSDDGSDRD